jgi:hypothetical protein
MKWKLPNSWYLISSRLKGKSQFMYSRGRDELKYPMALSAAVVKTCFAEGRIKNKA